MVRTVILILVFAICMVSGCQSDPPKTAVPATSESSEQAGNFWDTGYVSGELVFHGAAKNLSKKADAIQAALEDAARRVVIFNKVKGSTISSTNMQGSFLDYSAETKTSLECDENYKDYVDALSFDPEKDVFQSNNTVFVRVRYKSSLPDQIQYWPSSFYKTGKPSWVESHPQIPGYTVGVGYAGRRSALRDTIVVSYENAIFSMITALYGSAKEETTNVQGAGIFGSKNANKSEIRAEGVMNNFYILDTWVDPANNSVWTLAVAKKGS